MRSPLGFAGAAVIVGMIVAAALPFLLPVVAPQATCDLLAPILGCKGGAAPACGLQGHVSQRGRGGSSLAVVCPEGGGSAAPIYILAGTITALSLAAGITFLIVRTRRWRRQARPQVIAIQRSR